MCFTLLTSNRPARHSQCGVTQIHFHTAMLHALSKTCSRDQDLHFVEVMLKFLGAYALAKLLGFGLITALLIYMFIR
jgi:hypothetical protein